MQPEGRGPGDTYQAVGVFGARAASSTLLMATVCGQRALAAGTATGTDSSRHCWAKGRMRAGGQPRCRPSAAPPSGETSCLWEDTRGPLSAPSHVSVTLPSPCPRILGLPKTHSSDSPRNSLPSSGRSYKLENRVGLGRKTETVRDGDEEAEHTLQGTQAGEEDSKQRHGLEAGGRTGDYRHEGNRAGRETEKEEMGSVSAVARVGEMSAWSLGSVGSLAKGKLQAGRNVAYRSVSCWCLSA